MGALEDIKEKLAVSDEKIEIITTAQAGIKLDIAAMKAKLEANLTGLDAAGVAEVLGMLDEQNTKLTDSATQLADLDAETDPEA